MRLTIESIIILLLGVALAGILLLVFTDQSQSFNNFLGETSKDSKCELWKETDDPKYDNPENGCVDASDEGSSESGDDTGAGLFDPTD